MPKKKTTHTLEISQELFDSITHLKKVFEEMTGEKIKEEEEVIGILISGFIESLMTEGKEGEGCGCIKGEDCGCK